jgi:ABC-type oligopeptide transport system substrate-binding subunit
MRTLSARSAYFLLILSSLALFVIGCGHRAPIGPQGNTLRVAMTAEPTTFDPAMVQDGVTIDLLQQIYEGLVQWTPQNTLAPALATSWDTSNGGKTYTFHLRPNVKFQSGAPVTAQDVVFSIQRGLDPKMASPVALTYMGDIEGAEDYAHGKAKSVSGLKAIDDHTVQITITKPKAYWLNVLTYPTAYVVNPAAVAKDIKGQISDANTDGTGPFSLDKYVRGSYVDLKANIAYWDGPPKIDGQHRPILTNANTRHDLYLAGQLDMVDESEGSLEADQANPALKDQVKFWPRAATYYLAMNQKVFAPFKDVRVRQAIAYATDKQQILKIVFNDNRDLAQDLLPEGIPGYDPNFKGIPYDPDKAKQLLADAGYPGGKGFPPITVYYREGQPDLAKTVDILRQMYQQNLGITIQPRQTEWSTLLQMEDNNVLPCYHMRWGADYLDPQDYYTLLLRTGEIEDHVAYSNPTYDKLCDAADICQDPKKRMALYRQAAQIIAQEVPMIPLYYQKDPELDKPYLRGLDDSLMGHLPYKHLSFAR